MNHKLSIVAISDTHCQMSKVKLPKGDILIHSGDHSYRGTVEEMTEAMMTLKEKGKDFKYIVTICGNHDWLGETNPSLMENIAEENGIIYLYHKSVEIEGIKIFGSPYTPWFYDWAFNVPRGEEIKILWEQIPEDTNILITHGAPMNILDMVPRGIHAGCEELHKRVFELKDLKLHVFGHLHSGNNKKYGGIIKQNGITFINAAICNEEYKPNQKVHEFIYDTETNTKTKETI